MDPARFDWTAFRASPPTPERLRQALMPDVEIMLESIHTVAESQSPPPSDLIDSFEQCLRILVGEAMVSVVENHEDDESPLASWFVDIAHGLLALAEHKTGSKIFLESGSLPALFQAMQCPSVKHKIYAHYIYCCLLHAEETRDTYVERTIVSGMHVYILSVLDALEPSPSVDEVGPLHEGPLTKARLLAFNWFGGSRIGALWLVDHIEFVERIKAAYVAHPTLTLTLLISNLAGFVCEIPEAREKLDRIGYVDILRPVMESHDIRRGSVGVTMGIACMLAHHPDRRLLSADALSCQQLIECCRLSRLGIAQVRVRGVVFCGNVIFFSLSFHS